MMNSELIANIAQELGLSILGDLAFAFLVAIGVLIVSYLLVKRHRKRLFFLFGIDSEQPALKILLSRLDVLPAGSQGTDGRLAVGFTGPALMDLEYQGANAIKELLNDRFLDVLPNFIKRFIEGRSHYMADVPVEIQVSPDSESYPALLDQGSDALVLLGSDVYSPLVRHLYESPSGFIRFVCDSSGDIFNASRDHHGDPTFAVRTGKSWTHVEGRSAGRELGTIQRVTLPTGRQFMMCAGISASATCGSAHFLCQHWESLHEQFGANDFLIVLSFPLQEADSPFIRDPEILEDLSRERPPA